MEKALREILIAEGLGELSVIKYIGVMKLLGGKRFKDLSFLDNTVTVMEKVNNKSKKKGAPPTAWTRRGRLVAVMAVLRITGGNAELAKYYREQFDTMTTAIVEFEKSGEKNAKQKAYYMSADEIATITTNLKEKATRAGHRFADRQKYMLWSLYTLIPPRRNIDIWLMNVVDSDDGKLSTDRNYYVRDTKLMIFNIHKNAAKTGQEKFSLVNYPELTYILEHHLEHLPAKKRDELPLLQNRNGTRLDTSGHIYDILTKITGKKTGSNALRHLFAEHNAPTRDTLDKMMTDAKAMGHSLQVHITNYVKKTTI